MNSLLDTNVVSQVVKLRPDPAVVRWLSKTAQEDLFLSVISIAEVRGGIDLMPNGHKRRLLERWLAVELREAFRGRILPIEDGVAEQAGRMLAAQKKAGRTAHLADALIAATATVHGLQVATLNRKDFEKLGVRLVDF